jgi:hypothetical protein
LGVEEVKSFPPSLSSLEFGSISSDAWFLLPKTLTELEVRSEARMLSREICEGLAALEKLDCCLHNFESTSCLSAFKILKKLVITVSQEELTFEAELFVHLKSPRIEEIALSIYINQCLLWPTWICQLQSHVSLRRLDCYLNNVHRAPEVYALPEYLKRFPPRLTYLSIPPPFIPIEQKEAAPIISSTEFLECFRHFPKNLSTLNFGYPRIDPSIPTHRQALWLSDECFTHLPQSLTFLGLKHVAGLTDRFWDIIPPNIVSISLLRLPGFNADPSFYARKDAYLSKFEKRF